MSKTIGEATALLEPYGYRLEGVNGNGHIVFREPASGAVARVGTAAMASPRHRANIVTQAQRNIRNAQTASHRWVNWLLDEYAVPIDGECEVSFSVPVKAGEFLDEHPEFQGTSRGTWLMALKNSPQVTEVRAAGKGYAGERAVSTWLLRGPLCGVQPVTEPRASRLESPTIITTIVGEGDVRELVVPESRPEPRPIHGAAPAELVGEGSGGGGTESAARRAEDARQAPRGGDQTRVVGTRGGTTRPGPGIPASLATALSEHFSGDLRAENELLRSALADSLDALHKATETLQAALSLNGQAAKRRRGIGPKNLRRYELMVEYRTELDGPLTPEKLHRFFVEKGEPMKRNVAGSVLWTFAEAGLLRHGDAAGVYLWP